MKNPRTVAILAVLLLFLIVLFQNMAEVSLKLLFWRIQAPQIILIPIILLLGFAIGFTVAKLTGKKGKQKDRNVSTPM